MQTGTSLELSPGPITHSDACDVHAICCGGGVVGEDADVVCVRVCACVVSLIAVRYVPRSKQASKQVRFGASLPRGEAV